MAPFARFASFSLIREDLLVEHLEEAEFLWRQRDTALYSPDHELPDLAKLEARLDAHLDGLAVGGERSAWLLAPVLEAADPHQAAAAAAGLVRLDGETAAQPVLAAVASAGDQSLAGIVKALCYLPLAAPARDTLRRWLHRGADLELAVAWDVLSFHHDLPGADPAACAGHGNPHVRRAAALAAGRVGAGAWQPPLRVLLTDPDDAVRQAAWTAAARAGDPHVLDGLRERAQAPAGAAPWELRLLAQLGDPSDVQRLAAALAAPPTAEAAAAGLATLGYPAAVAALLAAMARPWSAAAAGAAFARIVGGDLPLLAAVAESDSQEDESFVDPRPLPDPLRCARRWTELQTALPPDQRLRAGAILRAEAWRERPEHGDLLTRREEITRLRHRNPEVLPNLELDAPSVRQQAAVAEVAR